MAATSPTAGGPHTATLSLRLALAFVAVALAAVAVLAGLTAVFTTADVDMLTTQQRSVLTSATSAAAGAAWARTHDWATADLTPVLEAAERAGADIQIRNQSGRPVASSPGFAAHVMNPQLTAAVVVDHHRVGAVITRFTASRSGLGGARRTLETDLLRAIAGAAGTAAFIALITALVMARWISDPVRRVVAATRARARGDRSARVGQVRGSDELHELATAFDDMADTVDREQQLRRDLVADVTHELRTPVAILQAAHEALLDGVAAPTPEQLVSLRDEVLRLARMVSELQDLAAADAASLQLSRRSCDLSDIAADAADSLAGRFESAEIRLERRLTSVGILADPRWLHQVVTNLLTNALKFTPAGGQVTVHTWPDGPDAVLTVTDTGAGIPADELPRIFDRFWRGRHAWRTSGSGIGLTIAAELVEAHGGQLTATSTPGEGTQMKLTLPRPGST